jgi:ribosomal silencing factor RsfS
MSLAMKEFDFIPKYYLIKMKGVTVQWYDVFVIASKAKQYYLIKMNGVTVQWYDVFVIASKAKQSIIAAKVDCFVATLLAMTRKILRLNGNEGDVC